MSPQERDTAFVPFHDRHAYPSSALGGYPLGRLVEHLRTHASAADLGSQQVDPKVQTLAGIVADNIQIADEHAGVIDHPSLASRGVSVNAATRMQSCTSAVWLSLTLSYSR